MIQCFPTSLRLREERIILEVTMIRRLHPAIILATLFLMLFAPFIQAHAGWSHDPAVNTVVTTQDGYDTNPAITDDGAGGAIIAWMGPSYNIYVQRIDANGNLLWGANGKAITSGGDNYYPQLVSDGSGGAFITWQAGGGAGNDGIYVQRIDANGNQLWSPGGDIICGHPNGWPDEHQFPRISSDGIDGAVITWQDRSNGNTYFDIFAQRVRSSDDDGSLEELWPANGLAVCTAAGHQYYPQLIGDGNGGVIITWQDNRENWDIYAQRIDPDGAELWESGGVPVTSDPNTQHMNPRLVSDGSGGAIISWQDDRTHDNAYKSGIYAQRLNSEGVAQWTLNGITICDLSGEQISPEMTSDGSGGAIIAWWDARNGANYFIYGQRVNAAGGALWTANGVAVATPASIDTSYYSPQIAADASHGAVITWADQRNTTDENVYAQRIDGTDGHVLWTVNGAAVSTAANHQQQPRLIIAGSGGAIITWRDLRNGIGDIYAQKVLGDGTLPATPTVSTATPTGVHAASATAGGEVISDGGTTVTARGVCWGPSPDPVLGPNCTSDGSGVGMFTSSVTGLTSNTPYHIRAYATNSVGTSYGSDLQFTTSAGLTLTVNLTGVGGGWGTVISDPWGINCTTGSCSASFTTGSQVTLTAIANGDSLFGNWGGSCTVTPEGKCTVTMSGNRSATATFNYVQPVRILGSSANYTSIGGAYAKVSSGGTIQTRVHEFTETLIFNRSISAIIKGGYDTSYQPGSGLTTVRGTVTVRSGSVVVENLSIR
jgi:hypothetical protein